jgi:hypothetical protein
MAAADELSGVHPGMTHHEIRAALDRATPTRQLGRHLVLAYQRTAPSASGQRADLLARLQRIADGEEPEALHGLVTLRKGQVIRLVEQGGCVQPGPSDTRINSGDSEGVSMTRPTSRTGGRPRKHASRLAAWAAASRAYRTRRKALPS